MAKKKKPKAGTSKAAAELRRAAFVEHYIRLEYNGTEAYKAAGFKAKNDNVAAVEASKLLREPKIFEQIVERKAQILAELKRGTLLTQEEVLQDLTNAMRFDPAELEDADGVLKAMKDLPIAVRSQLEGCEFEKLFEGRGEDRELVGSVAKVKYPKKVAVREQAMKFFGLFKKHQEQAGRAAGQAAGEAAGRAVADALDFDAIEKRVAEKLRARRRQR